MKNAPKRGRGAHKVDGTKPGAKRQKRGHLRGVDRYIGEGDKVLLVLACGHSRPVKGRLDDAGHPGQVMRLCREC